MDPNYVRADLTTLVFSAEIKNSWGSEIVVISENVHEVPVKSKEENGFFVIFFVLAQIIFIQDNFFPL